jgi:hypothetical protein
MGTPSIVSKCVYWIRCSLDMRSLASDVLDKFDCGWLITPHPYWQYDEFQSIHFIVYVWCYRNVRPDDPILCIHFIVWLLTYAWCYRNVHPDDKILCNTFYCVATRMCVVLQKHTSRWSDFVHTFHCVTAHICVVLQKCTSRWSDFVRGWAQRRQCHEDGRGYRNSRQPFVHCE